MNDSGFTGLLLELYKRQVNCSKSDMNQYDYGLFGFYDGISVKEIHKWSDFSPHRINQPEEVEAAADDPDKQNFAGKYTVKLLVSDEKKSFVKRFIRKDRTKADSEQEGPLFAILLLNMSWWFVRDSKSEEDRLKKVCEYLPQDNGKREVGTFGVFQSVGYYDYAILYRGISWEPAYKLLEEMREHIRSDYPIISNSYFMPGVISLENRDEAQKACEKIADDMEYSVAVHLNLREGESAGDIKRKIDETIRSLEGFNEDGTDISYYQQSGSSDCVVSLTGVKLKDFMRQYLDGGFFSPGSSMKQDKDNIFTEYISGIRTSVGMPVISLDQTIDRGQETCAHDMDPDRQDRYEELTEEYNKLRQQNKNAILEMRDALRLYRKIAGQYELHTRQIIALEQIMELYENMTHTSHTFDLQILMIPILHVLYLNLKFVLESMQNPWKEEERETLRELSEEIKKSGNEDYPDITRPDNWKQELRDSLQAVTSNESNFDLHSIERLQVAMEFALTAIGVEKTGLREMIQEGQQLMILKRKYFDRLNQLIESMDKFRQIVGAFLQSLSYSDRLFIERTKLSGTAIGSGAAILFAYNAVVRKLIRSIPESEDQSGQYIYAFLMTSGRSDVTETYNFSDYVPLLRETETGDKVVEERVLVTRLSERSIYDAVGTLLRLCHEIYHYTGQRLRKYRAEVVMEAYAALLVSRLLTFNRFLVKLNSEIEESFSGIGVYLCEDKREAFLEGLIRTNSSWMDWLADELSKKVKNGLEEIYALTIVNDTEGNHPSLQYYAVWYYDHLAGSVSEMMERLISYLRACQSEDKDQFLDRVLETLIENDPEREEKEIKNLITRISFTLGENLGNAFWNYRNGYLYEVQALIKGLDLEEGQKQKYLDLIEELCQKISRETEEKLDNHNPLAAEMVLHLLSIMTEKAGFDRFRSGDDGLDDQAVYMYLCSKSIDDDIKEVLMPAVDETVADYLACRTIEPDFSEYISSFLYEDWEIESALSLTPVHILRLGLIIQCFFLRDKWETQDIETGNYSIWDFGGTREDPRMVLIEELLDGLELHNGDGAGALSDNDGKLLEVVKERVRSLFREFLEYYRLGITEPIARYLKEIGKQNRQLFDRVGWIKKICVAGREDTSVFLNLLLQQWADLASVNQKGEVQEVG